MLGVVKCPVWVSMSEVQGTRTRHVIAIVCAAAVLIRLTEGFWPAEDTEWSAELVNTSSRMCTVCWGGPRTAAGCHRCDS